MYDKLLFYTLNSAVSYLNKTLKKRGREKGSDYIYYLSLAVTLYVDIKMQICNFELTKILI